MQVVEGTTQKLHDRLEDSLKAELQKVQPRPQQLNSNNNLERRVMACPEASSRRCRGFRLRNLMRACADDFAESTCLGLEADDGMLALL